MNTITLSMIVRNEAERYLEKVLRHHLPFVNHVVIIDDASTDDTVILCRDVLANMPHRIITNAESTFHKEHELRKKQWSAALETGDEWLLVLDADEILDGDPRSLLQQNASAHYFRLYDMWDENHYRSDSMWCAHNLYRPFLVRPDREISARWLETNQHCGRFPLDVYNLPYSCSEIRLKHLGWMSPKDRIEKYARYMQLDPNGVLGSLEQYRSILDSSPHLVWYEP